MKVITLGEIMLRLSPEGYLRFLQADKFCVAYGGGEANAAVSLSNFGVHTEFVTKLPDNELGDAAVNNLRKYGVGVKHIVRGSGRMGIYFLEKGASQRASKVIYDRSYSAMAQATFEDFDFDEIFENADWFHFTGITPALSPNLAEIVLMAAKTAKQKGLKVSCDLNYRKKLWTKEQAKQTMTAIMPYVDTLIANEEDSADVFGIKAQGSDITGGIIDKEGYKRVAEQLMDRFAFENVAFTLRGSLSASDNKWSAMLYDGKSFYFSKEYLIHIVDRVGGGDSFAAGLIYAALNNFDKQKRIEFAAGASCLKHSVEGDFNLVSVKEALSLIEGDGSGRVQR
ncbi:MAG: PfkB family carbohydrate kinase [Christensenellales bacterium]|jgi:2-dehydro-3-deoxygluconokinase|nr:sugar kinase [Clostridiales bacterium]